VGQPEPGNLLRLRDTDGDGKADEPRHFGRLAGLAVMPDGALLVSDDTNGMIYRVRYSGGSEGTQASN
jgi:glucose/arabinose dehydrogenase